ncbi:MAG: hypothetical protein KAH72_10935 [Flavobacteriaceae bacterium]|nr:hypothetical protein [Flavobacteriaceae bacterium]
MGLLNFLNEKGIAPEKVNTEIETDFVPNNSVEDEQKIKSDAEYFNEVDSQTGLKYDIPMLDSSKPGYYFKYINFMKIKERSQDTFNTIMGWN